MSFASILIGIVLIAVPVVSGDEGQINRVFSINAWKLTMIQASRCRIFQAQDT